MAAPFPRRRGFWYFSPIPTPNAFRYVQGSTVPIMARHLIAESSGRSLISVPVDRHDRSRSEFAVLKEPSEQSPARRALRQETPKT
jgi:hypothetical protein